MFEGLANNIYASVMRHIATTIAGALLAQGLIMGSQQNDVIGSIVFLGTVGWSMIDKYYFHQRLATASQNGAGK